MKKLEKYVCIHKGSNKLVAFLLNCKGCGGLTNICGIYENKFKIDIFKKSKFKEVLKNSWSDEKNKLKNSGRGSYQDEENGMWY